MHFLIYHGLEVADYGKSGCKDFKSLAMLSASGVRNDLR